MRPPLLLCISLLLVFGLGSGAGHASFGPVWEVVPSRLRRRSMMRGALLVRSWHERLWGGQGHYGDTDDPFGTSSSFFDDFSRDPFMEQCAYQPDVDVAYGMTRGSKASVTPDLADIVAPRFVSGWDDFYAQPTWSATTNEQPDWSATTDDQPDWNATVHSRVRAVLRSTMASAVRLRWDVGLWWLVVLVLCIAPALAADPEASAKTEEPHSASPPMHPNRSGGTLGLRLLAPGLGPKILIAILTAIATSAAVCWMVPGFNAGQAARLPPAWGPEMQQTYPFRRWMQDVLLWSVASDLDGSRKAALLIMQLKGGAQELARGYPPQTLIQGGLINGVQADPLTYVIHGLAERFAALGEELRLGSITELLSFSRNHHQHERIDEILVRFDVARQRAHDEGQLTVSITGLTWLLLRAVGVSDSQLLQILTPFGGNFPQTEQELQVLKQQLRRMGHVLENSPGNIASALRGSQNHRGYFADEVNAQTHAFHASQSEPHPDASHDQGWALPDSGWGGAASVPAYAAWDAADSDNWTDTETASSVDDLEPVTSTPEGSSDPAAISEHLWWAYNKAKMQWRQHLRKPPRAVRRYARRYLKGKGKGKGSTRPDARAFLSELADEDVHQVFKGARKGKGKGFRHTKGKGKGRRTNPRGKDGAVMRCFRCGSETHLSKECHLPRTDGVAPRPEAAANRTFLVEEASEIPNQGPLSGLVFMAMLAGDGSAHYAQEAQPSSAAQSDSSWQMPDGAGASAPDIDPWADFLRARAHGAPYVQAQPPPRPPGTFFGPNVAPPQPEAFSRMPTQTPFQHRQENEASAGTIHLRAAPATLPEFINLPALGFLKDTVGHRDPSHAPLLPAAGPSSLDPGNQMSLERLMQATSFANSRWLGQATSFHAATVSTQSGLSREHHVQLQSFHETQQASAAHRKRTEEARASNKRAGRQLVIPSAHDPQPYEQVDVQCALCQDVFLEADLVLRLMCRHLFHAECWGRYLIHEEAVMSCPVCRGSARVVSRFTYVPEASGDDHAAQAPSEPASEAQGSAGTQTPPARGPSTYDIYTPPRNDRPNADLEPGQESPYHHFPWWPSLPAENNPDQDAVYHTTTAHPNFNSLLIDPGAYTNLAGLNWIRSMAQVCLDQGLSPVQSRLAQPMHIQGVGSGSQQCTWTVKLPISLQSLVDGQESTAVHEFETPVVGGSGSSLPALLGLKSLRAKEAILVLSSNDTELRLILPGPGGVNIEGSPGTVEYPLLTAPSGHLLLRCDLFEDRKPTALAAAASVFPVAGKSDNAKRARSTQMSQGIEFGHGLHVQRLSETDPTAPEASASSVRQRRSHPERKSSPASN